jgi:hypothetical protein
MSGRNSRAHANSPGGGYRIFRSVWDLATDGGTTAAGAISFRGESVPAGWLIFGGFIDIHTALTAAGATQAAMGIAADTHWGAATDGDNLIPAVTLVNDFDAAIPRSFSAGNDTHGRDGLAIQVTAAGAVLPTITFTVANLDLTGNISCYLFAFAADNGTV